MEEFDEIRDLLKQVEKLYDRHPTCNTVSEVQRFEVTMETIRELLNSIEDTVNTIYNSYNED